MPNIRKRAKRHFTKIAGLGFVWFITAIAGSFIDTIWAVYVNSFVGSEAIVGIISGAFTVLSVFLFFYFIPFLERHDNIKIYIKTLFLYGIVYALFAFTHNFSIFVILVTALTILSVLKSDVFGIMIRDESKLKDLSRNEGFMYTLNNTGWLIGPLAAGFLASRFGVSNIFLLAAFFVFMSLILFKRLNIHEIKRKYKKIDNSVFENFKHFFRNKDLLKIYIVSGGINLWWGVLYIYVPLLIIKNGLGLEWVGIFLSAVIVPLVLFEYIIGRITDKKGFKIFFILGYLIMAIFAFLAFLAPNIFWIMGLLALASIGAAMLEATTETYFFEIIRKSDEEKLYGPYCTTSDIMSASGKFIAAGIILVLAYNYIFLALAIEMIFFMLVSTRIRRIAGKPFKVKI